MITNLEYLHLVQMKLGLDGMGYTVGTGVATAEKFAQRPTAFRPIVVILREGLQCQALPKSWHCQKGGGSDPCQDFLVDLAKCTKAKFK